MKGLAAALLALPLAAAAQGVRLGTVDLDGGLVWGRVCIDVDGDERCGAGDPGVAGARVLLEGGQVAEADAVGRYHLLEVPGRVVLRDRSAYGGHSLALDGRWPGAGRVRHGFELSPRGAVAVDVALPAPPPLEDPPAPEPAGTGSTAPERRDGKVAWPLAWRVPDGSVLEVDGRPAVPSRPGVADAEVLLADGENVVALALRTPGGAVALYEQRVHLVRRRTAGDLVNPLPPERLALVGPPGPGGASFVVGRAAPGVEVSIGGRRLLPAPDGLFAARHPGEELASVGARRGEVVVGAVLAVPDRELTVAGRLDGELSLLGDPGTLLTGRGAIAVRGRYRGYAGTAGVDLDDRDRDGPPALLLRPRDPTALERQLDPARTFPTAGDDGVSDDPNAPRGRVHARVTGPNGGLELGAFRPGRTGVELGRYDRALFGGKAALRGDVGPLRLEASGFGSSVRAGADQIGVPRPAHDQLRATGASLYWLRNPEVVAGSEALRVEWRDPLTGVVVEQRALRRGADYEIDHVSGRVLLARPLATFSGPAALATGDPLSTAEPVLHADYSHAAASAAEDVSGARAGLALGPLSLDAAAAREDRPGEDYQLASGAVALALGPALALRAELARSQGSPFASPAGSGHARSDDGGLTHVEVAGAPFAAAAGPRDAFHLGARGGAAGARWSGWWRERPAGFADSARAEAIDAAERGAEAGWGAGPVDVSALYAERSGADPRDPSGLAPLDARSARGRLGWRAGRFGAVAEALHQELDAAGGDGRQLSAGLRASWQLTPAVALDASHHQSIAREGDGPAAVDATFSALGARVETRQGSLSVRAGGGPELGPRVAVAGERRGQDGVTFGTFTVDPDAPALVRESTAVMGVRRRTGPAEVFTEEQFARDPFGLRLSRVAGAALEPARGLRLSVSAESGSRLTLDDELVSRRAVGAQATWLAGPLRLFVRGELRDDAGVQQAVAGGAVEWRVRERLTLLARGSWGDSSGGRGGSFLDAVAGAAFRGDGLSFVAKLARVRGARPGESLRDAVLASAAATLDLSRRLALGLGADLGLNTLAGARSDLVAGSARAVVRLAGPLDGALEYARRAVLRGPSPSHLDAGRIEVGVRAHGGSRLSAGYNVFGFGGSGVDAADERSGRLYVRASLVL